MPGCCACTAATQTNACCTGVAVPETLYITDPNGTWPLVWDAASGYWLGCYTKEVTGSRPDEATPISCCSADITLTTAVRYRLRCTGTNRTGYVLDFIARCCGSFEDLGCTVQGINKPYDWDCTSDLTTSSAFATSANALPGPSSTCTPFVLKFNLTVGAGGCHKNVWGVGDGTYQLPITP